MTRRNRQVSHGEGASDLTTWPKTGSGLSDSDSAARAARKARLRSFFLFTRFFLSRDARDTGVVEKEHDDSDGSVVRDDDAMADRNDGRMENDIVRGQV